MGPERFGSAERGAVSGRGSGPDPRHDPWAARSLDDWADVLGVPALELHASLDSTNRRLRELARSGATPFTTVVADAQTRGRGREGKTWHSPAGTGLWISVLLPLPRWGSGAVLPLAVGVGVAHVIERTCGEDAGLKWPNDVLVRGRKVAGVLCESVGEAAAASPGGVVVGVGVNLRRPPGGFPVELRESAGALEDSGGGAPTEPVLARMLLEELRRWAHPAPSELSGRLRVEWESRDLLRGRMVRIESGEEGLARGVSPEGSLRVALGEGRLVSVRSGGVRIADQRASGASARPPFVPHAAEDP